MKEMKVIRKRRRIIGRRYTKRRVEIVLLDDEDYARIACYKWHMAINHKNKVVRIARCLALTRDGKKGARALHHEVLGITKPDKKKPVDHINGNTLDNRKSNLRITTGQINCLNTKRTINRLIREKECLMKKKERLIKKMKDIDETLSMIKNSHVKKT